MRYPEDFIGKIICGNCLEVLKQIPDESINCCITSPPYWALRDYEVEGQLGLEPTFYEYLDNLITIFDEVRRVLRKDGTCWVVMGDTYSGSGNRSNDYRNQKTKNYRGKEVYKGQKSGKTFLPDKCLIQIPSRFAIMMTDRGWILRNEIIWYKPNAMPSSAKDRFTVDFEKVFFFVKNKKYWFEQQFEPLKNSTVERMKYEMSDSGKEGYGKYAVSLTGWRSFKDKVASGKVIGRNKRCVWEVSTKNFYGAHFAVFPEELVKPMIRAGCPEFICKQCRKARERIFKSSERINARPGLNVRNSKSGKDIDPNQALHKSDLSKYRQQIIYEDKGYADCGCNAGWDNGIVLDPFAGAGTTCVVAKNLGRDFIGIELNPEYCKMAEERLSAIS